MYKLTAAIIASFLGLVCLGQSKPTAEIAIYLPDSYISLIFKYHIDSVLTSNKILYRSDNVKYSRSDDSHFIMKVELINSVADDTSNISAKGKNKSEISIQCENKANIIIASSVQLSQQGSLTQSEFEKIRKAVNNANFDFKRIEIKDSKNVYAKGSLNVLLLEKGIGLTSKKYEGYFTPEIESLVYANLTSTHSEISLAIPVEAIGPLLPPDQTNIKSDQFNIFIQSKKFTSSDPSSLDIKAVFNVSYRQSSTQPFVKGKNLYEGKLSVQNDFTITATDLKVVKNNSEIEKVLILKMYEAAKSKYIGSKLNKLNKYFNCHFIFPKKAVLFRFDALNAFIRDKSIFINLNMQ